MGRRAFRFRCDCNSCTGVVRDRLVKRFEAKLVQEALVPDEEKIFDCWHDWDKDYDL